MKDRLRELLIAGFVFICWPIRVELLIGVKTPERWIALHGQLAALEQAHLSDQTWERAPSWAISLPEKAKALRYPIS